MASDSQTIAQEAVASGSQTVAHNITVESGSPAATCLFPDVAVGEATPHRSLPLSGSV